MKNRRTREMPTTTTTNNQSHGQNLSTKTRRWKKKTRRRRRGERRNPNTMSLTFKLFTHTLQHNTNKKNRSMGDLAWSQIVNYVKQCFEEDFREMHVACNTATIADIIVNECFTWEQQFFSSSHAQYINKGRWGTHTHITVTPHQTGRASYEVFSIEIAIYMQHAFGGTKNDNSNLNFYEIKIQWISMNKFLWYE